MIRWPVLQRSSAVRAWFDINPVSYPLIRSPSTLALLPTEVGPNPLRPFTRYLTLENRDFFAVYGRLPGFESVTVPFK